MNGKGIALLAIAVVAIGIFALPSTVSLFSGQHAWYDLGASIEGSAGRNNVPCEKCHADVWEEMQSEANGVHKKLTCAMCHRTRFNCYYDNDTGHYEPESSLTYARGHYYANPPTPGKEAHAASTIECMDCHGVKRDNGYWDHGSDREYSGVCWKCHGGSGGIPDRGMHDFISAGGFGFDTILQDPYHFNYTDTGEKAAHKTFVLDAINNEHMEGANEACIACHTHIPVKINWTHAYSLEFDATFTPGGGYFVTNRTHFNVTNMSVNGTVNITSYGNASGGANTSYFPPPVTVWDDQ